MEKYNIEGNIDFYKELNKSLDFEENFDENKNLCMITNEPLTEKFVTMQCGHKFNYIAIYNDILNHKQYFNKMEDLNGRLNKNEIRCPYCRNKQQILLPYYNELGLPKVNGVNFYNTTYNSNYGKCMFKYLNDSYDPNKPESELNSKYLINKTCEHYGYKINIYNALDPSCPITYGDNNNYCYIHKKTMIKQYKAQEKQKQKEAEKAAKQKQKETEKAAKQKLKDELKKNKELEKLKTKQDKLKKKEKVKNVIVANSNASLTSIDGCISIIKTGPNKGKHCGCKIISDNLCGRHKKNNNIIINN